MHEMSRRDFLRASALAAGGAALGACYEGQGAPQEPPVRTPTAHVAAVRGFDLYGMTREALQDIGGIEQIVHPGETVFIKPNMVTLPWAQSGSPFRIGECTKPEIIIAVAEECLKAGATEVIVGDGSHMPELDWEYATTLNGGTNLVAEAERLSSQYEGNMRVASLEVDSPEWVEVPSRTYLGTIAISSLVAHADRVISIPVAKTHAWAQLTLSLKNFIGVTPLERYAHWVEPGYWDRGMAFDHSTTQSIAAIYLDIVDAVKPDLAVVDFSIGVEGDGPSVGTNNGSTVDMRERLGSFLVLASTDIVAADATAARIMDHNVYDVTQLRMASEMRLGEINESLIEIVGERLRDLQVEWEHATLRNQLGYDPTAAPACPFARQLAHRLG